MARYERPVGPDTTIIGREKEQERFHKALASGKPELIAVYGRRRVGKTFLIRAVFKEYLAIELTGVRKAKLSRQLANFTDKLGEMVGHPVAPSDSWAEAFGHLKLHLTQKLKSDFRTVVFIDELPWLASRKSEFLSAFDYFWNSWGTRQPNLIVVVCGSAASWMIAKVIGDKGGLHNRLTASMMIEPFELGEVAKFLDSRGVKLEKRQVLELFMAIGGIPYYLDQVSPGLSPAQIIDELFFAKSAPLKHEFNNLFAALFEKYESHLKVIRALTKRRSGLTFLEIVKLAKLESGGGLTNILLELEQTGFVLKVLPFGKKKRDTLHRLIDQFTLFHLYWIEKQNPTTDGGSWWASIRSSPRWNTWSGYAFENTCMTHIRQIKGALGIAGVSTTHSSWQHASSGSNESGAQIDLLIDRKDDVINVCEMKYTVSPFSIDKGYAKELQQKLDVFRAATGTRKSLFLTMVTTEGVVPNNYRSELVINEVNASALFAQ
jgi:uncharacterized protein